MFGARLCAHKFQTAFWGILPQSLSHIYLIVSIDRKLSISPFSFDISIGSGWIPVGHLPTNFYVGFCTEFNVFRFRATCIACVLVVPCRWWTPLFETLSDVLFSSVVVILLTWLSWPTNRSILKLHCPEIPGYFASCSTIAVHSDTADRIL